MATRRAAKEIRGAQLQLDALVDWYKNNGRERPPIRIQLARCTCERFCTQLNRELYYRGHRIIPLHETEHCGSGG